MSISELKMLLGHEDNEYQNYRDFKKNVLIACQKAIKSKTDISFTFEPHSRSGLGGKIQTLRFEITKNQDYECQLNLDELLGTSVMAEIKREAEQESEPDVKQLSFISELSDKDKKAILLATGNDIKNIHIAYDMAIQQGNIKNLTAWLIHITGELQAGRVEPPVEIKRQPPKSRFINFEQRKIDYAELERLELEQFKAGMKSEETIEDNQTAPGEETALYG